MRLLAMEAVGRNLGAAPMGQSPLVGDNAEGGGWLLRDERPAPTRLAPACTGAAPNAVPSDLTASSTPLLVAHRSVSAIRVFDPPIKVPLAVRVRVPLVREVLLLMGGVRNPHRSPLRRSM